MTKQNPTRYRLKFPKNLLVLFSSQISQRSSSLPSTPSSRYHHPWICEGRDDRDHSPQSFLHSYGRRTCHYLDLWSKN